jgi:hypothetical protein
MLEMMENLHNENYEYAKAATYLFTNFHEAFQCSYPTSFLSFRFERERVRRAEFARGQERIEEDANELLLKNPTFSSKIIPNSSGKEFEKGGEKQPLWIVVAFGELH